MQEENEHIVDWSKVDWSELLPILLKWARYCSRRAGGSSNSSMEDVGMSAQDLVQTAILATMSDRRPWRGKVSLLEHLTAVIRSIASNEVKKSAHHRSTLEYHLKPLVNNVSDETALDKDVSHAEKFLNHLRSTDPKLLPLLNSIISLDLDTDAERAKHLGISASAFSKQKAKLTFLAREFRDREEENKDVG